MREEEENAADARTLNPDYLVDISGGDVDIIEALIVEFKRDAPIYMEELRKAADQGDKETIYKCSHKFKGMAANAGGERLQNLLHQIETQAMEGRFIPDVLDFKTLEDELTKLRKALTETDWKQICKGFQ